MPEARLYILHVETEATRFLRIDLPRCVEMPKRVKSGVLQLPPLHCRNEPPLNEVRVRLWIAFPIVERKVTFWLGQFPFSQRVDDDRRYRKDSPGSADLYHVLEHITRSERTKNGEHEV